MGFEIEVDEGDKQYQDESVLKYLYCEEGLSDVKISNIFDISKGTVTYWRNKHGIESWSPKDYAANSPATFRTSYQGYEIWDMSKNNEKITFYVHRLLAIAEYGFDSIDSNTEIHHKNGIPWDNRAENIEILNKSEHRRVHANERRNEKTGRFQ